MICENDDCDKKATDGIKGIALCRYHFERIRDELNRQNFNWAKP